MSIVRSKALAAVPHGFLGRAAGDCGLGSGQDPAVAAASRRASADAILPGAPLECLTSIR